MIELLYKYALVLGGVLILLSTIFSSRIKIDKDKVNTREI